MERLERTKRRPSFCGRRAAMRRSDRRRRLIEETFFESDQPAARGATGGGHSSGCSTPSATWSPAPGQEAVHFNYTKITKEVAEIAPATEDSRWRKRHESSARRLVKMARAAVDKEENPSRPR